MDVSKADCLQGMRRGSLQTLSISGMLMKLTQYSMTWGAMYTQKGYTLIEFLVAIAIIGILSALAVQGYWVLHTMLFGS